MKALIPAMILIAPIPADDVSTFRSLRGFGNQWMVSGEWQTRNSLSGSPADFTFTLQPLRVPQQTTGLAPAVTPLRVAE